MEATIQLNVRMNRSLKESGDDALTTIGLSPTQAVRALWEKAAKRGKDLDEVAALLLPKPKTTGEAPSLDSSARLREEINEFYRQHGIDPTIIRDYRDDNEVLADALYERMVERGLA